MVQYYDIMGQKVGSHILSLGILTTMFTGVYMATRGKKVVTSPSPALNASSKDEENFIQDFLKNADGGDAASKAKH